VESQGGVWSEESSSGRPTDGGSSRQSCSSELFFFGFGSDFHEGWAPATATASTCEDNSLIINLKQLYTVSVCTLLLFSIHDKYNALVVINTELKL
jgi:hypothetical protein